MSYENRRQIITRLKFIGAIRPHEKIDVPNLRIETSSLLTPFRRMLYGSSRETTLFFFNSTIERTFEIVDSLLQSDKKADQLFCSNALSDLITCIKGLEAVQTTYADDKIIVCGIHTQIEAIQSYILQTQDKHPDLLNMKNVCIVNLEKTIENINHKSPTEQLEK